ncbi:MAG: heparan-alpha-glucosaminide N-acetyltransferase domain-containing protein [Chloroflexota bacterium]|nr:heparan-alpha-glucosaminide N-acetyltransferase domain-containing protein [Chloroflexota bacterium]
MSEQSDSHPARENASPPRSLPIDALRGLIIVLMALDHANFFIAQQHSPGEYWGGPFPRYHDALPFLTRFVTHFSAPGFFFLMGVGMLLFANARRKLGWSERAIGGHFLLRGCILIALQLLVVNRAWELSPTGWGLEIYIGTLVALGGTMILGSLLLRLKPTALLILTIVLALGAELTIPNPSTWGKPVSTLGRLLLIPGGSKQLWVNYPVLPWLKLVTFGILFGQWMVEDTRKAFERAPKIGVALLLAFIVIRAGDGLGNIRPRAGDTWIDFLNLVKYPPSLTFTLLTTGVNLIVVGLFARLSGKGQRYIEPLAVFGRAPLFFYLLHLFLYAGMGHWLTPHGTRLLQMYPYWLLGLLILYPLCLWYGQFRRRQPAHSISRLF